VFSKSHTSDLGQSELIGKHCIQFDDHVDYGDEPKPSQATYWRRSRPPMHRKERDKVGGAIFSAAHEAATIEAGDRC
jgi:hypothetical protein